MPGTGYLRDDLGGARAGVPGPEVLAGASPMTASLFLWEVTELVL